MKSLLLAIAVGIVSLCSYSQQYDFPEDYKLEDSEDYSAYKKDVVKSVNWLEAAPANRYKEKRQKINAFVLEWISGSPEEIAINVNEEVASFTDTDDLYMLFIGGWARYAIETGDISNEIQGNIEGIKSVITYYTKNKRILGNNKSIEKYVKLDEKDKLESYVNSRF